MAGTTHITPKFDIYGWEIKGKGDVSPVGEVKLPPGWSYSPSKKTLGTLIADRRKGDLPDLSFDLDNDGKVGGQDLVLSKLFDKDGDGRLNTAERQAAHTAIESGFADKFVWGVEQAAPHRPFRLIQKRGQIIDSEDFTKVAETYGKRDREGNGKTMNVIREERAKERLEELKDMREKWEKQHPHTVIVQEREEKQTSLPYKTWTEKRSQVTQSARQKMGLTPLPMEIDERPPPSLTYIPSPKYRSKSHMRGVKHSDLLTDIKSKQNRSHLPTDERVSLYDHDLVSSHTPSLPGKTYKSIISTMKSSDVAHNIATFSNVIIGVHGQELPKFQENLPEYWKVADKFIPEPRITSQTALIQERKFWAGKDVYKLAEKDEKEPACDPFKAVHVPKMREKKDITMEPHRTTPAITTTKTPEDVLGSDMKQKQYRWTTMEEEFNRARRVKRQDGGIQKVGKVERGRKEEGEKTQEDVETPGRKWSTISSSTRRITKTLSPHQVRSSGFLS